MTCAQDPTIPFWRQLPGSRSHYPEPSLSPIDIPFSFPLQDPCHHVYQLLISDAWDLGRQGSKWPVQQTVQILNSSLGCYETQGICLLWASYNGHHILPTMGRCLGLGREDPSLYCRAASQPHISRQSWLSGACVQRPPAWKSMQCMPCTAGHRSLPLLRTDHAPGYSAQDFTLEPLTILQSLSASHPFPLQYLWWLPLINFCICTWLSA